MTKRRSLPKRLVLWTVGLLVFVELVLQVAAYLAWTQRHAGESRGAGDGPVVLCVGDSMTYGLGSTGGGSYPAQLEQKLRQRDDREWVVINGGFPGRSSSDVLAYLPDQLERFKPDHVLVLVGTNDQWSQAAVQSDSFPLVWRTGRLISILMQGRLAEHGEEDFVGTWNKDGGEVRFLATGRMIYGDAELRWHTDNGRLTIVMPDLEEVQLDWKREGENLRLEGPMWEEPQILAPGPASDFTPLQRAERAAAQQDLATARTEYESALAAPDSRWAAEEGLVHLALAGGDAAAARDRVAAMTAALEAAGDPLSQDAGEATAHALLAVGDTEAAFVLAERVVRAHPESVRGWEILIKQAPDAAHQARTVAAIDAVIPQIPVEHPFRSHLLTQRALFVRSADLAEFLRSLLAARRAGALDEHLRNHIYIARADLQNGDAGATALDTALERAGATGEEAAEFRALYAAGLAGGDKMRAVLADQLRAIIAVCRGAGAEPRLLDYPFRDLDHERLVDSVATDLEVRRIPIRPRFDSLLETLGRDDLFIRDDVHCNDRGYGEMADLAADSLLR